ncbi:ATP-binding cassette transporter, subfamily D, member 6, SmABCD6 [Corchorus olitorius]|uniref:ATP-binding cassette transporter, subfamily D, member 6, SmABCD6 n=1 Tax=Corchorus olitorius TaxID=93759 RepID=A0A1R3IGK0_9ROSI|nr:ATP-binding cassette transporter, subfamily D, member 6, SmABCD6 [Corchorus olitorius]
MAPREIAHGVRVAPWPQWPWKEAQRHGAWRSEARSPRVW